MRDLTVFVAEITSSSVFRCCFTALIHFVQSAKLHSQDIVRVPVRVSHVAIGESSKELAKRNVWTLAILAKPINIYFS